MASKVENNIGIADFTVTEKAQHLTYLNEFRTRHCSDFLQHKCALHRPFMCFNWHFANQKRRCPVLSVDGTFNYSPDNYCPKYDETTGLCPDGDECALLHRTSGDTERRYHLRYYKTCPCVHETDKQGNCVKNAQHCPFAHGPQDLRRPIFDQLELQATVEEAAGRIVPNSPLNSCLETDRLLNEDPVWNDPNYVLANYKTDFCLRPLRLCRQGFACPSYHNPRDKRRSPAHFKYRSTPCPNVKVGEEWGDPLKCETGDSCGYCHTRTEQQFHLEIYKSSKCNDMVQTVYCPRGHFCAFAHVEQEMNIKWDLSAVLGSTSLAAYVKLPSSKKSSADSESGGVGGGSTGGGGAVGEGGDPIVASTRFDTALGGVENKNKNHFSPGSNARVSGLERGDFSSAGNSNHGPGFSSGVAGIGRGGLTGSNLQSGGGVSLVPGGGVSHVPGVGGGISLGGGGGEVTMFGLHVTSDGRLPEPIGKGRTGLTSHSGSLNEGYLSNYGQLRQDISSLNFDQQQQQQQQQRGQFRQGTMSIGSYHQFREQLHQQQQLEQQRQLLMQQHHLLKLQQQQQQQHRFGMSGNVTSPPRYSLVERQQLADYLSNTSAPPQTAAGSSLPSTFFANNETMESIVGASNDDDIDLNFREINLLLDHELSRDNADSSLSSSFNTVLSLSGGDSFMGGGEGGDGSSMAMSIPGGRDGQRHHSVGSISSAHSIIASPIRGSGGLGEGGGIGVGFGGRGGGRGEGGGVGFGGLPSSPAFSSLLQQQHQRLDAHQQMTEGAAVTAYLSQQHNSSLFSSPAGGAAGGMSPSQQFVMGLLGGGVNQQPMGAGGGAQEDLYRQHIGQWDTNACQAWMKEAELQQRMRKLAEEDRNRGLSQVAELNREVDMLGGGLGGSRGGGVMPLAGPSEYEQHHMSAGYTSQQRQQRLSSDYRMPGQSGGVSLCSVCQEQSCTVLVHPCNHCALCYSCALMAENCPLCRTPILLKSPVAALCSTGGSMVGGGGGGCIPNQ